MERGKVLHNWRRRLSGHLAWVDDERHARAVLIATLAIALALRLAAALAFPIEHKLTRDAALYVALARNVVNHGVFGPEPGVPFALVPPGYPLYLAAVFALTGKSLIAARLGQALLAAVMVWQTYAIGRQLGGRCVAVASAVLIALYPPWIVWPVRFLTEPLYAVLLLAFVWCVVRSAKACTVKWAALAGVAFGLALLTREVLFAFPLALPAVLWWCRARWRAALAYVGVFAVSALVTISPWLIRNSRTFGHVFYTERIEAARYRLTGRGYLSPRYQHLAGGEARPRKGRPPEFYERYGTPGEWVSVRALVSDPVQYLRHTANRFVELWLHPNGLASLPRSAAIRGAYVAAHLVMLALAGMAVVAGLRRRDAGAGILALFLAYNTLLIMFFGSPQPRYALPFLPLVFVLAASALCGLLRWLREVRAGN